VELSVAVNLKLCLFYGLLIAAIILLALYFMGVQPFKGAFDGVAAWVSGFLGGSSIGSGVMDYISKNWVAITAAAAPIGISAIVALITNARYKAELQAKKELAELSTKLSIDNMNKDTGIASATSEIEALKAKLAALEGDTTAETLQTRLSSLTTSNAQLTQQATDAQNMLANVMKQLAAGATEIKDPVTGTVIKIIDKIVVK